MVKRMFIVFGVIVVMSTGVVFCSEISSEDIFKRTLASYIAMETYRAEGTIIGTFYLNGQKMETETLFLVLLKKPNLYLISWTQKYMPMPAVVHSGAVWSDGTQSYLYLGNMNAYFSMANDELALASATGISGGAAYTIPFLFLPIFDTENLFSRIECSVLEGIEYVGKEKCFVISGQSAMAKSETFWIEKDNFLLKKYQRLIDFPGEMPELTVEELEKAIKNMGLEPSEENKKKVREMIEGPWTASIKIEGSFTEIHMNITNPALEPDDFVFDLPEGTAFKGSFLHSIPDVDQ